MQQCAPVKLLYEKSPAPKRSDGIFLHRVYKTRAHSATLRKPPSEDSFLETLKRGVCMVRREPKTPSEASLKFALGILDAFQKAIELSLISKQTNPLNA